MKRKMKPIVPKEPDPYYNTQLYQALNIPKENLVDYDTNDFDFTVKEITDGK